MTKVQFFLRLLIAEKKDDNSLNLYLVSVMSYQRLATKDASCCAITFNQITIDRGAKGFLNALFATAWV